MAVSAHSVKKNSTHDVLDSESFSLIDMLGLGSAEDTMDNGIVVEKTRPVLSMEFDVMGGSRPRYQI